VELHNIYKGGEMSKDRFYGTDFNTRALELAYDLVLKFSPMPEYMSAEEAEKFIINRAQLIYKVQRVLCIGKETQEDVW